MVTCFQLPRMIQLVLLIFFFSSSTQASSLGLDKKILLINSYHAGYAWSDAEQSGVLSRLQEVHKNMDILVEYLDAKHRPDLKNLARMKDFLAVKYRSEHIDLIVALDNPALDMLALYQRRTFSRCPRCFCRRQ